MDIDKEKQLKVIEKTSQLLHSEESKRILAPFSTGCCRLGKQSFWDSAEQ